MNISYRWLKSIAPGLEGTPGQLAERLAMLGAPVDEVVDVGAPLGDVLIARVDAVVQHPNADRLRVCTVDAGGDPLQVVCGAPNVVAGGWYPFAPVGARLPGGIEIRRAKLRGEASEGMLCSARELGLGREHAGLMALHGEFTPGAPFRDTLGLDDALLVVDVTPNRSELLSHVGVARELAPRGEDGIELPAFPGDRGHDVPLVNGRTFAEAAGVRIEVRDEEGCPRYAAAVIRGVAVAPSPEWLASRLRVIGVRPINNVVDATNYVLHELGQPIHAFDLARLRGGTVEVRAASSGETLRTLDGEERALQDGDLVIADGAGPVALAGVMGGAESEVGEGTTELLVEVALFDPRRVRSAARRLGLNTDASHRFERGIDPDGQPAALARVVELILAIAGGEAAGGVDLAPRRFERRAIGLREDRVERVLGTPIGIAEIRELLEPIGFEVDTRPRPMRVLIPGFRPDVTSEVDLIEEVARRRGYDTFEEEILPFRPTAVPEHPSVAVERRFRDLLVGRGFLENRGGGFGPRVDGAVPLLNPLSSEEGFLRTTVAHGLLRRVERNLAHGVRDVRLFEIGAVFAPGPGGLPAETSHLAVVMTGAVRPPHWSGPVPDFDLWDARALLEELARAYPEGHVEAGDRMVALLSDGRRVGEARVVTPGEVDGPAWAGAVLVIEAALPAALPERGSFRYHPLPAHPGSERDLALLLPDGIDAGAVAATVRDAAGPLLEESYPFDLYQGDGLPEGTRSLAVRLRFRAADRTLTDAEVDAAIRRVLAALDGAHGVRRR